MWSKWLIFAFGTTCAKPPHMANTNHMGQADRLVYEMIGKGQIDRRHGVLYRRQLIALSNAGLVRLGPSGIYEHTPREELPTSPEAVPMGTLTVRVPQDVLDALDAIGPSRSDAARIVLGRGLAGMSGVSKRRTG
jgi:hypothetical protein